MKGRPLLIASMAIAALTILPQTAAKAANSESNGSTPSNGTTATSTAAQMVPANAILDRAIDSKSIQPGQQFQATLTNAVKLKNGPELPKNTVLVGVASSGQTQGSGGSNLALRFTEAKLKNGQTVPVTATIMDLAPPSNYVGSNQSYVDQPLPWDGKTMQVDQINALSGVDLHSRIAGNNSGVFVSTRDENVKLTGRSQLSLAIAGQS